MFRLLLSILAISSFTSFFLLQPLAVAQNNKQPEFRIDEVYIPRFLPPHPFYFLKKQRDNLKLFLTFDKAKKAQAHLDLANKRVMDIAGLSQRDDLSKKEKLLREYSKNWDKFFDLMSKVEVSQFDGPSQKARRNLKKQKEILSYLASNAPSQEKEKISQTLKVQEEKFNQFFNTFQGTDQLEKFKEDLF